VADAFRTLPSKTLTKTASGKMILMSRGKEFLTYDGKMIFMSHGKMFFISDGKQFFT